MKPHHIQKIMSVFESLISESIWLKSKSMSSSHSVPPCHTAAHTSLLVTCITWWLSAIAQRRMPLSSGEASSESRYWIASCTSSGRLSHDVLTHHGCIWLLSCLGNHSLVPQRMQASHIASSCSPMGPPTRLTSRCHCACH